MLTFLLAVALLMPASGTTQAAASQCATWASQRRPPPSIRVLMVNTGRVVSVPFRLYVERVTSSEWGGTPTELCKAGAVAVKQYGWSRVIRWSGRAYRGRCFHVRSDNSDQIYKSHKVPPAYVVAAVRQTWRWTLRHRDGRLVHTGYRTGSKGRCAHDAGRRLYARSAARCARAGWSAQRVLLTYYAERGAHLEGSKG